MTRLAAIRDTLAENWRRLADHPKPVQLMEICGTHTVAVSRGGLRDIFPEGLRLVSGPGCPVCVTDQSYIDAAMHLAGLAAVTIATYGDMVRVPGKAGSLERARSAGADVQIVYAAHEAVALARRRPDRQVVFLAVGFETTTPATALAAKQARDEGLENFSIFAGHKLVLPAMHALLGQADVRIDGFMCPGHVSVIIGWRAYEPIVAQHRRPCVVAGFEEDQILAGIAEILCQMADDAPAACSVYPIVTAEGNARALEVIDEVFTPADVPWRALGVIPASGLALREEYAELDASLRFDLPAFESYEMPGCRCGDVICGRCLPTECELFGRTCTPRSPVGPCMVSTEGSCAAYYKYAWREARQ
ncbi:hypothetical protein LCGC14_2029850 [marine sediment metagenome]|uniref:Hydrogenase formation HypD protein n=1 Tax=marine sediment metagenome TaxID=412755 RepID=A0A0F9EV13_9ZZZZ